MNKKDKNEWMGLFGEAFREVILPAFDDLNSQIQGINYRLDTEVATKADIDRLERRLVSRESQLDRLGNKVDNHEKRIGKLELKTNL
jgi:hypothetical protein